MKVKFISRIRHLFLKNISKLKEIGRKRKKSFLLFFLTISPLIMWKSRAVARGYSRLFRKDYKVIESMLAKLWSTQKLRGTYDYLSWAKEFRWRVQGF